MAIFCHVYFILLLFYFFICVCRCQLSSEFESDNKSYHENRLISVDDLGWARLYFGWIPLVLALIALLFSAVFAIAAIQLMLKRRVGRKYYALLLNRTVGDIIACVAILVAVYYWLCYVDMAEAKTYQAERVDVSESLDILRKVEIFVMASFWTAMVAYSALSFLKFYAAVRLLHYKKNITIKRCICFIVISWIIAALLSASDCFANWRLLRVSYIAITYFLPLICFIVTVIVIKQSQNTSAVVLRQKSRDHKKATQINHFPLWKLGVSVAIFTVFSACYTIFFVWLTLKDYVRHRNAMFRLWAFARNAFLIRIMLDCICGFLFDPALRNHFVRCCGLNKIRSNGTTNASAAGTSKTSHVAKISCGDSDARAHSNHVTLKPPENSNEISSEMDVMHAREDLVAEMNNLNSQRSFFTGYVSSLKNTNATIVDQVPTVNDAVAVVEDRQRNPARREYQPAFENSFFQSQSNSAVPIIFNTNATIVDQVPTVNDAVAVVEDRQRNPARREYQPAFENSFFQSQSNSAVPIIFIPTTSHVKDVANTESLNLRIATATSAVFMIDLMCEEHEPRNPDQVFKQDKRLRKYFSSADQLRHFIAGYPHLYKWKAKKDEFKRTSQRTRDLFEKLNDGLVGKVPTNLLLGRIQACDENFLKETYGSCDDRAIEKFLHDYDMLFDVSLPELSTAKQKMAELHTPLLMARKIRQWSLNNPAGKPPHTDTAVIERL